MQATASLSSAGAAGGGGERAYLVSNKMSQALPSNSWNRGKPLFLLFSLISYLLSLLSYLFFIFYFPFFLYSFLFSISTNHMIQFYVVHIILYDIRIIAIITHTNFDLGPSS